MNVGQRWQRLLVANWHWINVMFDNHLIFKTRFHCTLHKVSKVFQNWKRFDSYSNERLYICINMIKWISMIHSIIIEWSPFFDVCKFSNYRHSFYGLWIPNLISPFLLFMLMPTVVYKRFPGLRVVLSDHVTQREFLENSSPQSTPGLQRALKVTNCQDLGEGILIGLRVSERKRKEQLERFPPNSEWMFVVGPIIAPGQSVGQTL